MVRRVAKSWTRLKQLSTAQHMIVSIGLASGIEAEVLHSISGKCP